jgi:DMSO/TMAO reductase YedYZ molybdopterin-dependent catalytic subunit
MAGMTDRAKDGGAMLRAVGRRAGGAAVAAVPALAAGLLAALAATALMLALRLWAGVITLPELLAERVLPQLNAGTFVHLLIVYGKITPLVAALLGQIALGVLIAPLLPLLSARLARLETPPARIRVAWRRAPARRDGAAAGTAGDAVGRWPRDTEWLAAGLIALGMWAVALALFWPVLAESTLGFAEGAARAITMAGLAAVFALYGAALALVYHALAAAGARGVAAPARLGAATAGATATRRAVLVGSGVVALGALALGGGAIDSLLRALYGRSNLAYEGMETRPPIDYVTPNARFYVVSKNVIDPTVVPGDWSLEVGGLVARPGRLTLGELRALPGETRAITLECIANGVSGTLVSNAVWGGVPLDTVLRARGGALRGATRVLFTGADGYQSDLPLADLLAVRTLLAYEMNGAPLPDHHGFPLRAVVPGRFGEQSPKWITRIQLIDDFVKGFYQSQGWYDGPLYTISRIDAPGKGARLRAGRSVTVHGIAFGGARGISLVEVSTDDGRSWRPATLAPPLSGQTWVLWRWPWTPAAPGAYTLVVRATDGAGGTQITADRGTVPEGGTGLHRVPVTVK